MYRKRRDVSKQVVALYPSLLVGSLHGDEEDISHFSSRGVARHNRRSKVTRHQKDVNTTDEVLTSRQPARNDENATSWNEETEAVVMCQG
jgi:hypothetical protein